MAQQSRELLPEEETEFLGPLDPETGLRPLKQLSRSRKRRNQTVINMVWSMGLIVATVIALVVFMNFRNHSIPAASTGSTDVGATVKQVADAAGFALANPQLPANWKATLVRYDGSGDPTWRVSYSDPTGAFAEFQQVKTVSAGMISSVLGAVASPGTQDVAGIAYETFVVNPSGSGSETSKTRHAIACQGATSGAIVSGTSSTDNLTVLMTQIAPSLQ